MPYILPDIFLDKINTLQQDYERIKDIALNDAPKPYALLVFFGAPDTNTRQKQCQIIAFFLKQLKSQLQPSLRFKDEQELLHHIDALMIMVTVSLFIQSNTSRGSVLRDLLNKALLLSDNNSMDLDTWKRCLLVTQQFLTTNGLLSIDQSLQTTLRSLNDYIHNKLALITEQQTNHYPITSALLPLLEGPLEAAGTTAGYVIGDMCGRSASLLYTPWVITATLGSGAFWMMGATTGMGVFLLAPVITGQLINTLCSLSMAYIMGTTMRLAGTVIGSSSGLMLDMSWQLLSKTCTLITNSLADTENRSHLTGLILLNGHRVISGIEFTVNNATSPAEQNKQLQKPVIFTLNKDCLLIQIGEEKAVIPLDLNNPCIAHLYQTLQHHDESQFTEESSSSQLIT